MKRLRWAAVSIAAVLPACDFHLSPAGDSSAGGSDLLCGLFWRGEPSRHGDAIFAYAYSDAPLSRPMAAGGATVTVGACSDYAAIDGIASTNPDVAAASSTPFGDEVDLVTGTPGETDLVAYAKGAEMGRVTVHVADTTELLVEHGWPGTSPAILAGQTVTMHTTTRRDDETLVGIGAVTFSTTGSVHLTQPEGVLLFGDIAWFRGEPGVGSVVATCPSAGATVPITVVAPSAITSINPSATHLWFGANEGGLLSVRVFAGAQEVYGARCSWTSDASGLSLDSHESLIEICGRNGEDCRFTISGESLDAPPTFQYYVSGPAGHYQATCTIAGGPSTTVTVDIH